MPGSKFLTLNPGTIPDDTGLSFVAKASTTYGGMTVIAANFVTGAVGTFDVILMNYGTSGTVAGGTVGSMASGTATVWAADTPQALTLTAAQVFADAGEWLVLKKIESAADNDFSEDATLVVEYVDGIVTQG
jgi:hypothetical protein